MATAYYYDSVGGQSPVQPSQAPHGLGISPLAYIWGLQQQATDWITTSGTTSTAATIDTTLFDKMYEHQQYAAQMNIGNAVKKAMTVFYRINKEVVEGCEVAGLKEPLDELRIKVAKWLRRGKGV